MMMTMPTQHLKCITITLIETVANNHLISNSNKFQLSQSHETGSLLCSFSFHSTSFYYTMSIPSGHYLPFTLKLNEVTRR